MPWIESHDEVWEHHKTMKLTRLLGVRKAEAVGCLHGLWHFVLRNAWRDANLEPWGDEGIESAAQWEGKSGEMVAALRESGYLDGYIVHGWSERAGKLVQDRMYNETKRRGSHASTEINAVIRRKADATLPNPTVPNPTQPYPTNVQPAEKRAASFKAPTLDEVSAYCTERNKGIDASKFVAYYEARGWMLGKAKMKSWQAAVRTWENSGFNTPAAPGTNKAGGIVAPKGKYDGVGEKM